MKVLSQEKIRLLAESKSWSLEYASGFSEGETQRRRAMHPASYVLVGLDQYCLGFRAGYFERQCNDPRRVDNRNPAVEKYSRVA